MEAVVAERIGPVSRADVIQDGRERSIGPLKNSISTGLSLAYRPDWNLHVDPLMVFLSIGFLEPTAEDVFLIPSEPLVETNGKREGY